MHSSLKSGFDFFEPCRDAYYLDVTMEGGRGEEVKRDQLTNANRTNVTFILK